MSFPNGSTALAEVVLDELVRGGVRHVVIAPGSRSAALAIAAARHPDLSVTVQIDERSAAFYALGVGRATGVPAAVVTTSGSAVAHLHPAVVEADTGMVPLLLLTADRPPELHGTGANQTIEQANLFGNAVRFNGSIGPPERRDAESRDWRAVAARAVVAATHGPAHLNVAFREPVVPETDDGRDRDTPYDLDTGGRPDGGPWPTEPMAEVEAIRLDRRWSDPERGLVIVGDAPFVSVTEVDRLAAMLGWPLVAEPTAGHRPSQAISTVHHLVSDPAIADRIRPDVAVVVGRVNLSRPLSRWIESVPRLVCDPRIVRAEPPAEVIAALPAVPEPVLRSGGWRRSWLDVEAVARRALDGWLDASPQTEMTVARDTADAVPDGGVLVAASSMPIRDLDLAMRPGGPLVVSNRGASGIDGVVSTAYGVAAGTGRPVVVLTGDLALLHDSNGFLVDPRPDVVFVVVNNDGGGIFSFLPQVRQVDVFERVFATPHGRSFEPLAAFHGIGYRQVEDVGEAVRAACSAGGSWILEVAADRETNPAAHRALTAAVTAAVSLEG